MLPDWITQDGVAVVVGGVGLGLWRLWRRISGQGEDAVETARQVLAALELQAGEMKLWGEKFTQFQTSVNLRFDAQARQIAEVQAEVDTLTSSGRPS